MIEIPRFRAAGALALAILMAFGLILALARPARSYDVAGYGTYAVYADLVLALGALGSTGDTDPDSGPADTAATPEAGETLAVERRDFGSDIQEMNIQKRLNMSNAPGGTGLGNWTLVIDIGGGTFSGMRLYTRHFCLQSVLLSQASAETSNVTADSITMTPLDIRFRQGGYFAPMTSNDNPCRP